MNYPIRIAQIMGKMNSGGVEAVIMNYYRAIDKSKYQFDFIVDEDSKLPQKDEILSLGGRIFVVPSYSKIFAYNKALKNLFLENKYEIVHANLTTLNIFSLRIAKKCGIKTRISHSHNTIGKGEFLKSCLKNVFKIFSNKYLTDRFACSEEAGKFLFKNKDFVVVKNAIDYDKFKFDLEDRKKIREDLGVISNEVLIGHIGRFNNQKNHQFIIDVFNKLHHDNDNFKLLLIGEGPDKQNIIQLVNDLKLTDAVIFRDVVLEPYKYYSAMDLFIFPSKYEGFGNVAIEAQVSGLNVLASNYVPKVTKISKKIKYLDLNQDIFINEILKCDYLNRDISTLSYSYSIKENVKKLEELYYEFYK